jgi:hypothetical protein
MKRKIGLRHTVERGCMKNFFTSQFSLTDSRLQFQTSPWMCQFSENFLPVEKKKNKLRKNLSFNKDKEN